MRLIDSYADQEKMGRLPSTAHVGYLLRTAPDWDYVAALREGGRRLRHQGRDGARRRGALPRPRGGRGLGVQPCGRQFDGAPASIDVLPEIRAATACRSSSTAASKAGSTSCGRWRWGRIS
jgi:L-lactate dehydrogenase (cytochrome)